MSEEKDLAKAFAETGQDLDAEYAYKQGQMTEEEKQECRLDQLDDQDKEEPDASVDSVDGAALSVTQASLLGLPFGSGFHRDDAGRPMRTGAPVLTGKRLERMKKSCQHNHKTLTLTMKH